MDMRRRTGAWLLVLLMAFGVTACGNSGKDTDKASTTAKSETTKETPIPQLDGVRTETYDNYSYAGYEGTMEYCYRDDALFYHKWYLSLDDKKKAKKAYKAVCAEFKNQYGAGEAADDKASAFYTTSWKTDTEEITVQHTKTDSSYEVSFTVTEK